MPKLSAGLVVVLGLVGHASTTRAAAFLVTSADDIVSSPVPGTLRYVVANLPAGNNVINIAVTGTITLNAELPPLTSTLTVNGPGADQLTIKPALNFKVLTIAGKVQISGVTIQGGVNTSDGQGGGIAVNDTGSLVLLDSVVTGNSAALGAAIYARGLLTIQHCAIVDNTAGTSGTGPVIYAAATTSLIDSSVADNHGTAIAFAPSAATLTIDRSTISGNVALGDLGGLDLQAGVAAISNTTFSGNAGAVAGDFQVASGATLNLVNVTAVGSGVPALSPSSGATVTLLNTLFAGTGARCAAGNPPTSRGHNLVSDSSCGPGDPTDRFGVDPMLGPLADNGGTTKSHILLIGSPAANAGGGSDLEDRDQRGYPRIQFGKIDIGAVEITEPVITQQPQTQEVALGAAIHLTVVAHNQNSASSLFYQWRKDGAPIAGATGDIYTVATAKLEDSGTYDVLVGNNGGDLTSAAADLTVRAANDAAGCCSATSRTPSGSGAALALAVAALLGYPRRSRTRPVRKPRRAQRSV
jgi:hypothetical protein